MFWVVVLYVCCVTIQNSVIYIFLLSENVGQHCHTLHYWKSQVQKELEGQHCHSLPSYASSKSCQIYKRAVVNAYDADNKLSEKNPTNNNQTKNPNLYFSYRHLTQSDNLYRTKSVQSTIYWTLSVFLWVKTWFLPTNRMYVSYCKKLYKI